MSLMVKVELLGWFVGSSLQSVANMKGQVEGGGWLRGVCGLRSCLPAFGGRRGWDAAW